MLVLAADTSTNAGSLALADVRPEAIRILVERSWDLAATAPRRPGAPNHSDRIVPEIEEILRASGVAHGDLEGLACAIGPGSFTGLRVALSALKGIALASSLPLAGVSTLEALASNLPFSDRLVVPMLDARKSEIYGAAFESGPDGRPRRRLEDQVSDPGAFLDAVALVLQRRSASPHHAAVVLGDACGPYVSLLRERLPGAVILDGSAALPRAGNVARLAAPALLAGRGPATEAAGITPAYLRRPEAEWKQAGKK